MIQLSSLTKAFGERILFENVTWQISGRERVGLCGPNGAGKTTLLKLFAGLEEPDTGAIIKPPGLQVGYLPQDGLTDSFSLAESRVAAPAGAKTGLAEAPRPVLDRAKAGGRTVHDEASLAFQSLLDVNAEMHVLEA